LTFHAANSCTPPSLPPERRYTDSGSLYLIENPNPSGFSKPVILVHPCRLRPDNTDDQGNALLVRAGAARARDRFRLNSGSITLVEIVANPLTYHCPSMFFRTKNGAQVNGKLLFG